MSHYDHYDEFQKKPCLELYLLQNVTAGYIGNSPVFWHKSNSGYTQWIDEAKVWTKEEADRQIRSTRGTHQWQMWSVREIESVAKRTVDIQDLQKFVVDERVAVQAREDYRNGNCETSEQMLGNLSDNYGTPEVFGVEDCP